MKLKTFVIIITISSKYYKNTNNNINITGIIT